MTKSKTIYAVVVRNGNDKWRFVTSIDDDAKIARWEKGKPALIMGKYEAENLVMGLNLNFFVAYVIQTKDYMKETLVNVNDEAKENKQE